ncbi:hypothetical protein PsorP6_012485 [Peronosclerospora sorghi]|uniref:Uncharacterized protein n=1 Tax=Peronosclerospora sorghi TaxID=230839 RepID=A0ACC0WJA6_9STRA|nr:hypothetical protein PsorP6_012485 [Peronosclerospora sorghi]
MYALVNDFEKNEIDYMILKGADDVATHVYAVFPHNHILLNGFHQDVIDIIDIDCTYKTNMYCIPLFHIIGATRTQQTIILALCLMSKEAEFDYQWVLE